MGKLQLRTRQRHIQCWSKSETVLSGSYHLLLNSLSCLFCPASLLWSWLVLLSFGHMGAVQINSSLVHSKMYSQSPFSHEMQRATRLTKFLHKWNLHINLGGESKGENMFILHTDKYSPHDKSACHCSGLKIIIQASAWHPVTFATSSSVSPLGLLHFNLTDFLVVPQNFQASEAFTPADAPAVSPWSFNAHSAPSDLHSNVIFSERSPLITLRRCSYFPSWLQLSHFFAFFFSLTLF